MPLDKSIKDQIVLAALTAAGTAGDDADAHEAAVLAHARAITATLIDDTSKFHTAVDEIDGSSKFVAMINAVRKEASSKRAIVYFENASGPINEFRPQFTLEQVHQIHLEREALRAEKKKLPDLPDGLEMIRTERTDLADGVNLARYATGLTGHRVVVFKIMEPTRDPKVKVRVVRHLKDLGVVDSYVVPQKAPASA
ncbi:hypothetical protein ACFVAJ_16970 [Agromyces sp. NPDC057679]|uniref:hypothetical protein n=1 Tax=Agromyces sp. NPDC057679 TaxID=3346207 RepID=UPI0036714750